MRRAISSVAVAAVLTSAAVLAGAAIAAGEREATVPPPRVTLIGDSIAKALEWNEKALAILRPGIDLQLDSAVCRRLAGQSCPYEGKRASTLVELVAALGPRLGQTVIVTVGYNDFESTFAASIDASVRALRNAGVTRIFWVTLRAARRSYLAMNDDIRAAAARYPSVMLVDWNRYARSHPDWFQNDGIHLFPAGGVALATLLRQALDAPSALEADEPPVVTTRRLPAARQGRPYAVRLRARGGSPPYRWRLTSGPLPTGLRLRADGLLSGTPRAPARTLLRLLVTDANGLAATQRLGLLIRPRPAVAAAARR